MSQRALIVMAKAPAAGRTKTRLCPPLTPEQAADLYAAILQDVLAKVASLPGVAPFVAVAPAGAIPYFRQLAPNFTLLPQAGATLSERLAGALERVSRAGFAQVVAVSSDSPTLPAAYLEAAFTALAEPQHDAVLGPCEDGGYYLIGWHAPRPALIREVRMSTPHVLRDTLAIARRDDIRVAQLPVWYDIDELADLARLQAELRSDPAAAPATAVALSSLEATLAEFLP